MNGYLPLLQAAAVIVVACVLIVGSCADMYAVERTKELELGGDAANYATKFQGRMANHCRSIMVGVVGFIAPTYTVLLIAVLFSIASKRGWFPPPAQDFIFTPEYLTDFFALAVALTLLGVCWITCFATLSRRVYMRNAVD